MAFGKGRPGNDLRFLTKPNKRKQQQFMDKMRVAQLIKNNYELTPIVVCVGFALACGGTLVTKIVQNDKDVQFKKVKEQGRFMHSKIL